MGIHFVLRGYKLWLAAHPTVQKSKDVRCCLSREYPHLAVHRGNRATIAQTSLFEKKLCWYMTNDHELLVLLNFIPGPAPQHKHTQRDRPHFSAFPHKPKLFWHPAGQKRSFFGRFSGSFKVVG